MTKKKGTHSRQSTLESYREPKFKIPENWTRGALTMVEAKRIARFGLIACYATEFPRRLGQEASAIDLAADKRLSKRLAYVYLGLWERYTMTTHAPLPLEECPPDLIPPATWHSFHAQAAAEDEVIKIGSTVIWEDWWAETRPKLVTRRMMLATYAMREKELSWGYRLVIGLTDEIRWVDGKIADWRKMTNRTAA